MQAKELSRRLSPETASNEESGLSGSGEPVKRNTNDSSTEAAARMSMAPSHAFRALRHRNFRLFFGGQTISLIGTWMTRIATSWLVYRLTKSAMLLGTVGFAVQIPDVPSCTVRRRLG